MHYLKAVIFGAIGTIAETSDIQRQAFNQAFREAGLDWHWDSATYHDLLHINGGQNRIRAFRNASPAHSAVTEEMIASLHDAKTTAYVAILRAQALHPRPGVADLITACLQADIRVAFCTSTSQANVEGIRAALGERLPFGQFATIVTLDQITQAKPAPDAYLYCLTQLGLQANEVIAIEDTPVSLEAAQSAGIVTIATPGATTSDQNFSAADLIVPDLSTVSLARMRALLDLKAVHTPQLAARSGKV